MRGLPLLQTADALRLPFAREPKPKQPPHSHQHPRQSPTGRCTGTKDHKRISTIYYQLDSAPAPFKKFYRSESATHLPRAGDSLSVRAELLNC
jgi:hypothetical protein